MLKLKKTVRRLKRGDNVLVETHFGDLVVRKVIRVDRYAIYVPNQSFSIKSGWEVLRNTVEFTAGKALRDRIHTGNGKLFTEEDQENLKKLMAPHYQRLDLILKLQTLPSGIWLSKTTEQLQEISDKIHEQTKT